MDIQSATWWSEMDTTSMNDDSFIFNELSSSAKTFHFENMKTEIPSGTTINFSSSEDVMFQTFGLGVAQKKSLNRTNLQAKDHVLAERKRRERLTQRFIALSTLIPNLRKLDKASVLGDAIKYIKQLQEKVKSLENKAEGVVEVKRGEYSSSSDENSGISMDRSLPEIQVKATDGNILIGIYCNKQIGIIKEIFSQVEKLQLSIISSSIMPFGCNTTHITIIAQMDHKSRTTPSHVANRIREAMMNEEASSLTA